MVILVDYVKVQQDLKVHEAITVFVVLKVYLAMLDKEVIPVGTGKQDYQAYQG
jgi:hypothetical protein